MKRLSIIDLIKNNWVLVFWSSLLLSIFFPIQKVIYSQASLNTGVEGNFSVLWLYSSDLLILALAIFCLFRFKNKPYISVLFIIYAFIRGLLTSQSLFSCFFLLPPLLLLVAYETLLKNIHVRIGYLKKSLIFFTYLSFSQSILAMYQWFAQKPLGFFALGEPHFSSSMDGIAKLSDGTTTLVRAYGTFPHPNILAIYLVVASIIQCFLMAKHVSRSIWNYLILISLNVGLFLTFSRGALLAYLTGILSIMLIGQLIKDVGSKHLRIPFLVCLLSLIVLFATNWNLAFGRYGFNDYGIKLRGIYNHAGIAMIKENLWFGVGPGMSLFQMKHYSPIPINGWQIQPIHNFFLLFIAEFGLFIILFVTCLMIFSIKRLSENKIHVIISRGISFESIIFGSLLLMFSITMLIDHYFYTSRQGQFLLLSTLFIFGLTIKEAIYDNSSSRE